jgi:hypothetical protein
LRLVTPREALRGLHEFRAFLRCYVAIWLTCGMSASQNRKRARKSGSGTAPFVNRSIAPSPDAKSALDNSRRKVKQWGWRNDAQADRSINTTRKGTNRKVH